MGFFKKDDMQDILASVKPEKNSIVSEVPSSLKVDKRNLVLFDENTIQYVIDNFPTMSEEIQKGLLGLSTILENTIDHIEDKSSKLIKDNRNFKLSQAYRDTCISVYGVVENIKDYVQWMKDEDDKNKEKQEKSNKTKIDDKNSSQSDIKVKSIDDSDVNTVNIELEIYKDFSGKDPKGFELENNIIIVDDWDDLLVKTAEILTKQYKENRHSNIAIKQIKAVDKKSLQNEFRDTVIEMLNEYKISLKDFKIIVK